METLLQTHDEIPLKTDKRGRGRPKSQVKNLTVYFRISEQTKNFINHAALSEGMSFSAFITKSAILTAQELLNIDVNEHNEAHLIQYLRDINKQFDKQIKKGAARNVILRKKIE